MSGVCTFIRGFKALKQIVKLHYKLGNTDAMLTAYRCEPCAHALLCERLRTLL